ncbi:MAG TPA: class I SAM-dependent methyltransferase [Gaiellaceae bacterium]
MKDRLLRVLERGGVLRRAYRLYELAKSARPERPGRRVAADGLPVPPRRLIVRVAGTASADWFLEGGHLGAETIRAALARQGRPLERLDAMLDFGCGCGRVTRYWADLEQTRVHGTDANADAVDWCRRNLTFARFEANGLAPPLPHEAASFDLVYALSVFTHLTEDLQQRWMAELERVLRPGGLLMLTTHGDRYRERLTPAERARFDAGDVVVRWSDAAGTNLCSAFHPRSYVEQRLATGLRPAEFVAEGAAGNPHQDLHVLRKP